MKKKLMGIALAIVVFLGLSGVASASDITFYTDTPENNGEVIGTIPRLGNTVESIEGRGIATPEKLGYNFIGWQASETFIIIDNISNPRTVVIDTSDFRNIYRNGNAYGMWEAVQYGIEYDLDGGEESDPEDPNPTSYTIEEEVVITDPVKEGYTFLGWLNEDGEEVEGIIEEGSTGDKFFTATWEKTPEETSTETPKTATKNPKTGVSATRDIVLLIIGLISFTGLVIYNPKKNN